MLIRIRNTFYSIVAVVIVLAGIGIYTVVTENNDQVTLTAFWVKQRPLEVLFVANGPETVVPLSRKSNTDSFSIDVPYVAGGDYSVIVSMGSPTKTGYSYGCSIKYRGEDLTPPKHVVIPGTVSCQTGTMAKW